MKTIGYQITDEEIKEYEDSLKELKSIEDKEQDVIREDLKKRQPLYDAWDEKNHMELDGSYEEIRAARRKYEALLQDRYSNHANWKGRVNDLRYKIANLKGGIKNEALPMIDEIISSVDSLRHVHRVPSERDMGLDPYRKVFMPVTVNGKTHEVEGYIIKWNYPAIEECIGKLNGLKKDVETLPLKEINGRINEVNKYLLKGFDPKRMEEKAVTEGEWLNISDYIRAKEEVMTSQNIIGSVEVSPGTLPPPSSTFYQEHLGKMGVQPPLKK